MAISYYGTVLCLLWTMNGPIMEHIISGGERAFLVQLWNEFMSLLWNTSQIHYLASSKDGPLTLSGPIMEYKSD